MHCHRVGERDPGRCDHGACRQAPGAWDRVRAMSELFTVQVTEVTREYAVLWVDSVHPDSGPPMPTATFALMLMYDPIINSGYSAFRKYRHIESSPLAQAMDRDDYLNASWIPANARAFVAKVKVSRGSLTIWPTHPGWIEHLRVGMAWDTAAYSNGPGQAVPKRVPEAPGAALRSSDPSAGFRVGAPKSDDYKLPRAFIALHGSNRYVADPVIKDPATMATAVRELIGQPVVVVPKRGPNEIGTIVEVREDGVYLYSESEWGWGGSFHAFVSMAALGRAWLKVKANEPGEAAPAKKAAKKAGKKTAKVATKKIAKVAAKKTAKVAARKTAKVAAKKTAKVAAKKTSKVAAKKTAKVGAKKTAKVAAKKRG